MKKIFSLLFLSCFFLASMAQQKYQGFEGTPGDNWTFTATPARYIYAASEDYWGDTTEVGDNSDAFSPATGSKFWTVWDIENNYTNSPHVHTLEFAPVNIASFAVNTFSFKYATNAFDSPDSLGYIVAYDNGTTWDYNDFVALDKNTGAWTTVSFNTPANSQYIRVLFYYRQNGGGDWAGLDDVSLTSYNNDVIAPTVTLTPADASVNILTNVLPTIEFDEDVRLLNDNAIDNNNVDALVELRLNDSLGQAVPFDATFSNTTITVTPQSALQNNQQYYLALKANTVEDLFDNAVTVTRSVKFTTIAQQTQFNPGDLVPVAYRMNASSTEDEIAILTLVNILPGTFINFTDAKYTDNAQPQCAGGFTWEAPTGGVAAGTVIQIQNDALAANIGTLTGNGFGLSSGGDQVIVYSGTPANPSYIMALSSNAWLTNNSSCSGSESKLPASLTDGTSSINLSTAPGNTSGNTVNAYYTGTMSGTPAQLRTSILNPANWNGVGAGTAPQTWPNWSFPGPPSVVSVSTISQNSILIVFSSDLDATSAATLANYTGIAGLTSAVVTNNGTLADSVTLTYASNFVTSQAYSLVIANVVDADLVAMFAPYTYNFSYSSSIAFREDYLIVHEDAGTISVELEVTNPSSATVDLVLKSAPWSTTDANDITFTTQALTANSVLLTVNIAVADDATEEQDEYFVLALENTNGLQVDGSEYLTIYIKDNDRKAKTATKEIELSPVGSYAPVSNSSCEIVMYDAGTQRLFATSAIEDRLDIIDFSNPASPQLIKSVDMSPYGGITSVAVWNGIVAVASPNADEQQNGSVVFFNTDGDFRKQVTVGALPDMVTFSHDGKLVMTANEGQPNNDYTNDPEGSVSIIDISGGIATLTQNEVNTLDFTAFNAQEATLIAAGVRKTYDPSTLSQDLEPEYITISSDSKKAWVALQENNAIAELNLENQTITGIWALGEKDLSLFGNGFDASDRSDDVLLANWNVKAFFMPDGIASFSVNGKNYLVTANEGDEKEYGPLDERTTVGNNGTILNPAIYPNAEVLKEDFNLGRLRITNINGRNSQGEYDQLYVVGPRSFSIWDADQKSLVYDSGDDIELFTSQDPDIKDLFNADNEDNDFKGRSRAKGPEPEGTTVAKIGNDYYAFIGLERTGGVMVYKITDPNAPEFVDYKNLRDRNSFGGDNGPEGLIFIAPSKSPDGKAYLIMANEISGSLSIFEVTKVPQTVAVGFAGSSITLNESDNSVNISATLNNPAEADVQAVVKVNNGSGVVYGSDYSLNPAPVADSIVLNFAKGSTGANIVFTPLNDVQFENDEQITLTLTSTSEWLKLGSGTTVNITLVSEDPNAVKNINTVTSLSIYPNPATGVNSVSLNRAVSWEIIDVQGKTLLQGEGTQIDIRDLKPGTYILRSQEGEQLKFIRN